MINFALHYEYLESNLEALSADVRLNFSAAELIEIREFVNAKEFGLALETIAEVLSEKGANLDDDVIVRIQGLAEGMDLYDDHMIQSVLSLGGHPAPGFSM